MLAISRFALWLGLFAVPAFAITTPADDPYTCAADRPCKLGCCSKTGVCGLGPKFCAADVCQSSCDAKSDCDPGWGSQWSARKKCPLNVCCSEYGFCGTTKDFCGDEKVPQPSCSDKNSASQKVIGYYEGWSSTRDCRGMFPEDLLVTQYTHLNYAFAFIDPSTFTVAPMAELDKELWPRFTALKKQAPGLQTWISVGGWSMNDPDQPTAKTFSQLAASTDAQNKFFKSLVNFMSTHGFDGVDIDWEYPVAPERSGQPADYQNYVSFLKKLRNALGQGGHKYGLTLTLPSSYWYMQNFDIKGLEPIVDWFNVMTYDLHGTWDSTNPYLGPYINSHTNLTEIQMTMDLLWRNKIDPGKVVMGMGFYGRSFTLTDPSCTHAGCPFSAGGNPGPCTSSAGTLSYAEIEDIVAKGGKVVEDKDAAVAIVAWDNNQWVSYDNDNTLKKKMDYANSKCLGGVMVWAASTDDASGNAIFALNRAAGRPALSKAALSLWPSKPVGQCVWGECDRDCPTGFSAAKGSGGKTSGYAGIFNGCNDGKSRYYCCPTGTDPKCEWKGSAPFCGATSGGRCSDDQVEVTTDTSGGGHTCWTGHKSLCCSHSSGTEDVGKCKWLGSAPFCTTASAVTLGSSAAFWSSADCDSGHPTKVTTGKEGAGGEQPCLYNGGWKSFCCSNPSPYDPTACAWYQGRSAKWTEWGKSFLFQGPLGFVYSGASKLIGQDCKGECPVGQIPIATDGTNCQPGTYSYYCCPNPNAPALPVPGDAMCARPGKIPGRNSDPDPEGAADHVFAESEPFNSDCSEGSFMGLFLEDRAAIPNIHNWTDLIYEEPHLDPRGLLTKRTRTSQRSNFLQYCVNNQQGVLIPQTYSGYRTVAGLANKGWISVGKPLACGAVGVIVATKQATGVDYVLEHVFEKQSLRNILQHMAAGTLPGGGQISIGAVPRGTLDLGGLLFQNWPTNAGAGYGDTPMDTAYGALGHTANGGAPLDANNLQVVDADLNAIKSFISAYKDYTNPWGNLGDKEKVGFLSDVIDTFQYMQLAQTKGSYNAAFKALLGMWKIFATIASAAGYPVYDYSKAFTEVVNADLANQIKVAVGHFKPLLDDATKIWKSNTATLKYTASEVGENQKALADFASKLSSYIAYDMTAMTKP